MTGDSLVVDRSLDGSTTASFKVGIRCERSLAIDQLIEAISAWLPEATGIQCSGLFLPEILTIHS